MKNSDEVEKSDTLEEFLNKNDNLCDPEELQNSYQSLGK